MLLFVDNGHLGFPQFAGALRRRGVYVEGVIYPLPMSAAKRSVLAILGFLGYGKWRVATDEHSLTVAISGLDIGKLQDVICGEFHLDAVIHAAEILNAPDHTLQKLRLRRAWADKKQTYQALRAGGIPVPNFIAETDPNVAADQFGFPLVVKSRLGNGGYGVRTVNDRQELRNAVDALGSQGWGVMFEKHVPGNSLCYVAAIADGRVLRHGVYEFGHDNDKSHNLPSTRAKTLIRRDVVRLGEQVAKLVGGSELINIDIIDSPTEGLVVVDVNLRVWGNIVALNSAAGFFADPYLATLGYPVDLDLSKHLLPNVDVKMFPTAIEDSFMRGEFQTALRDLISSFKDYAQWTDTRYMLAGGATLAIRVCARLGKLASSVMRRKDSGS